MNKDLPLNKRVHFRRNREIVIELANYEGFKVQNYDVLNITAYETVGQNLKGNNVKFNIQNGYSCWVVDNRYEMFEVPFKSNKTGSPYGNILYLAHNTSFQYYLFGTFEVLLDEYKTRTIKQISENMYFRNFGKYDITFGTNANDNYIHKSHYGSEFDPGVQSSEHTFDFDTYNSRKIAYKIDKYKILVSLGIINLNYNKIVGSQTVKIYNKKA